MFECYECITLTHHACVYLSVIAMYSEVNNRNIMFSILDPG